MTRLENRIRVARDVAGLWYYKCDEHGRIRVGNYDLGEVCTDADWHWRMFHAHRAQGVCQRCGHGGNKPWDQRKADTVEYAADLCDACQQAMDAGAE